MTLTIRDCPKAWSDDQEKARTPEETLRWARECLGSLGLSLLARTVRIDTGRLGIPVYLSLCGEDATRLTGTQKQMGKGATPVQSETSAVMELAERVSFFRFVKEEEPVLTPYGEAGPAALPVEALLRALHDTTTPVEAARGFLRDFPMRMAWAKNLATAADVLVPFDWFYLINEYNGPAAGNTVEEAVLQALCEVIERHVGSVVSHDRLKTPRIDPASLTDPAAVSLLEKFRARGIRVYLRDFSLDTGIPTVGVLVYDPATFPEKSEIVFTAGTTSDPQKSLCRALTEIAQLAGDFESRTSYRPTLPKYETLEDAAYLMEESGPAVPVASLPSVSDPNLRIEIERACAALGRVGLEPLALDVTHPGIGIPVVYVMIPGAHFLEHTRGTDFPQHAARVALRALPAGDAARELERLSALFGPRYDLTFFLAHTLELLGRPEEALPRFEEALAQNPDMNEVASIYVHMASCEKDLERYHAALENLEMAEVYNKDLKEVYNLRGFCCYRLKRHPEAVAAFERCIELDPGSAIDYANIGANLREMGHIPEAILCFQNALDLDPDLAFARDNVEKLGKLLAEKKATAGKKKER